MSRRIAIIGATRGTGRQLVQQALEQGYEVTAVARTAAALPAHPRLRSLAGNVTAGAGVLAEAVRGQDAVISALGRGLSLKSEGLMRAAIPALLAAMQAEGVRRLLFTSAIGVGDAGRDVPLFSKIVARVFLRDLYADKVVAEALIRQSDLDWTIVQPAQLTNGPLTGVYRAGERLPLRGMPRISRADTAHFILRELEESRFIRRTAVVAY